MRKNFTKLEKVYKMSQDLIRSGLHAGTIYHEVWIRDYNTFIEVACDVLPLEQVRESLIMFLKFQDNDGNIIDGYISKEKISQANVVYEYRYSDLAPNYAGHKNTVITDQESSLVQAVSKYLMKTGDVSVLQEKISGITILKRLELSMEYLLIKRFSNEHGLIWSDTTIDWGDIQPMHELGVLMDENSHLAISIYINTIGKEQRMHLYTESKNLLEVKYKTLPSYPDDGRMKLAGFNFKLSNNTELCFS